MKSRRLIRSRARQSGKKRPRSLDRTFESLKLSSVQPDSGETEVDNSVGIGTRARRITSSRACTRGQMRIERVGAKESGRERAEKESERKAGEGGEKGEERRGKGGEGRNGKGREKKKRTTGLAPGPGWASSDNRLATFPGRKTETRNPELQSSSSSSSLQRVAQHWSQHSRRAS